MAYLNIYQVSHAWREDRSCKIRSEMKIGPRNAPGSLNQKTRIYLPYFRPCKPLQLTHPSCPWRTRSSYPWRPQRVFR